MPRSPIALAVPVLVVALVPFAASADSGHDPLPRERVLDQTEIPVYGYRIVETYPHATSSYTEGLVMVDGELYEGTGLYGHSRLRHNELSTGEAIREVALQPTDFGEGVTVIGDRVYQLTYLHNTGFIYDRASFERIGTFRYITQGWGLTTDGESLIMSDGSSALLWLDPETFEPVRHVFVHDDVGPVGFINELEYVDGTIYANVWQTDFIAAIDAETGKIEAWIDLTGLNPDPERLVYPYVLNGIAHDAATGHLLVTGKEWPHMWAIDLVPRRADGSGG